MTSTPASNMTTTQDTVTALRSQVEWLRDQLVENAAQLELQKEDLGWQRITQEGEKEMSPEGVKNRSRFHRVLAAGNPLLARAGRMRASYVFGDGIGFVAEDDAVNQVIQDHVDDTTNRNVLYGAPALERHSMAEYTDGNVFIALPTDRMTGKVTVRHLPLEEITEIITAPGDTQQVQFYLRQWTERDPNDPSKHRQRKAAYPNIRYRPTTMRRHIRVGLSQEDIPVHWDIPVVHQAPNRFHGQKWGTADMLPIVPWAEMYKKFLQDWSQLTEALMKIAWQVHGENSSQAQQMRGQMESMHHMPAGSSATLSGQGRLEAVPKSGATIDSDSGRPLASMVATGAGIPVTTLLYDPGQTGARAVAETLGEPMRKGFRQRQSLEQELFRQITEYVILQAILAPRGPLRGRGRAVREGDHLTPVLRNGNPVHVRIDFPSLDDHDLETMMEALAKLDGMDVAPGDMILHMAARALGWKQVDELMDRMTDTNGDLIRPSASVEQAEGAAAMRAARAGRSGNLNAGE